MSGQLRKIQKNANKFTIDELYKNMTPEQYRAGIKNAVKKAVDELSVEYEKQLVRMREDYNNSIREGIMIAMDTLSVEIIYELGNVLECYEKEPENLDQKIDIVQNIYETAMNSIKKYADYKTDNQAQRVFSKKKKTIEKVFGIYGDEL